MATLKWCPWKIDKITFIKEELKQSLVIDPETCRKALVIMCESCHMDSCRILELVLSIELFLFRLVFMSM